MSIVKYGPFGFDGFKIYQESIVHAALHHTYGFVTKHICKPYGNRVQSTLDFIQHLINFTYLFHQQIKSRVKAKTISETSKNIAHFMVNWTNLWRISVFSWL